MKKLSRARDSNLAIFNGLSLCMTALLFLPDLQSILLPFGIFGGEGGRYNILAILPKTEKSILRLFSFSVLGKIVSMFTPHSKWQWVVKWTFHYALLLSHAPLLPNPSCKICHKMFYSSIMLSFTLGLLRIKQVHSNSETRRFQLFRDHACANLERMTFYSILEGRQNECIIVSVCS